MRKLLALVVLALATCSPLPAEQPAPISPEPSQPLLTVPLEMCEQELRQLEATHQGELTKLSLDFESALRLACEAAAAGAVRPLLVDIAGLKAERAVLVRQRNVSRCIAGVAAIVAVVAVVWGLVH